ncbi:MAG: hypothetical protein J6C23_08925 [Clostridia bacterium]|nr:hypothetical protein [Clostridia bacterium]
MKKSIVFLCICIAVSVVALALSVISYACMMEALGITSALGYNDRVIPHCVGGITCGGVAIACEIVGVIMFVKAILLCDTERKNGEKSVLSIVLFVVSALIILSVLTIAFSSMLGSIGFLG